MAVLNPLPVWLYLALYLIEVISVVLYLAICESFFQKRRGGVLVQEVFVYYIIG